MNFRLALLEKRPTSNWVCDCVLVNELEYVVYEPSTMWEFAGLLV